MTSLPRECVIDASFGVKVLVPELHSDAVQALVAESFADRKAAIYVPDLFFTECANVLWKYTVRRTYPVDTARDNLVGLIGMGLVRVPSIGLVARALDLACECAISAYDGCYSALAEHLVVPLITADDRLVGKLAAAAIEVIPLSQLC